MSDLCDFYKKKKLKKKYRTFMVGSLSCGMDLSARVISSYQYTMIYSLLHYILIIFFIFIIKVLPLTMVFFS